MLVSVLFSVLMLVVLVGSDAYLSLLSCVVLVICVPLDVLLVSFPLIPFPCFDTCLCVWFFWVVVVLFLFVLLTL